MKSIFPAAIDGDLLKLVHLSNSFRMVEGVKPLQVGDVCRPEARIVSVTNSSEGKIVKVKGHCYRNNQPVIEVISFFLYRGRFVDYENTFNTTEEPDYLVHLESDADVGALQSKEWFEWDDTIVCHHRFWRALPLFSAFNLRSPSRTRPPIATFPSPVMSSFGTNSRFSSRSALWTSSRMICKAILSESWLICNATECLRVWLPLSPTATH
jgi:N-terminal half of MaoC dehydratase